jgi:hypothetical protein
VTKHQHRHRGNPISPAPATPSRRPQVTHSNCFAMSRATVDLRTAIDPEPMQVVHLGWASAPY